jgi:phosphatidyl-myo-inositol dimannoside synthase
VADALLVTSSFLPGRGGIESYLGELCGSIAPRLAVFAQAERDGKPIPSDLGYDTVGYPGRLVIPHEKVARAIDDAAKKMGTKKVVFGTPWPLVLLGPRLKGLGYRYAVLVHGAEMLIPSAIPVLGMRLARALSEAELLLPVSDYTAGKAKELLTKHGLKVPPMERLYARVDTDRFTPQVDGSDFRERAGIAEGDKVILCFGRLVKRKGVHRIIEGWDLLADRCPEAHLVVAGTGPALKGLRRAAERSQAKVTFLGQVSHEDAPSCYAACDLFALPVTDRWFGLEIEGLGVVLLEAAAAGKPAVTGRSGGTPEAVVDEVTGFVVDASDRQALMDALASLLTDREQANTMGAAGRRHVEENFSSNIPPKALVEWLD